MNTKTNQTYCQDQVKSLDRDRFLTALFAPADRRPGLFALYAFNLEVAKIREVVSEPTLGRIRLQWWRDALTGIYQGTPDRHLVVEAMAGAVHRHGLRRERFERLIDARERDLEEGVAATLEDLVHHAAETSSTLTALALQVLGVGERERAAHQAGYHVGVAWGLTGLLRARPILGAQDAAPPIKAAARAHLSAARALRKEVPKAALPALLPAVLADRTLGWRDRGRPAAVLDQLVLYGHAVVGRY